MRTEKIIKLENQYIVQTYARPPFVLERGNGMYLFDTDGHRYLDFVSGLSVNAFGYRDYDILKAMEEQANQLMHCSNLYHSIPGPRLAQLLVEHSFSDRVFFCNSGTESIEASIKFARKWGSATFSPPKYRIVAMRNSFHGRTYGALTATGQFKYHQGFEPMLPGTDFADLNDLQSVDQVLTDETCAIMVEPLQAEGGVHLATDAFLSGLRKRCDERGMLLIFDEVQCGLGRTGSLFAYEQFGVEPDIMTLAKPLGGGLPLGATLVRDKVAASLHPGDHAATFGANPVICAMAIKVFERLTDKEFMDQVEEKGRHLHDRLNKLKERWPDKVKEVRGRGLIAGVVTVYPAADLVQEFRKRDVLVCIAGPEILRMLPPLVVKKKHIDEVVDVFDEMLRQGVSQEEAKQEA